VGAHILAPFPREWECSASPDDWTHFSARISRRRRHRTLKGGELAYEDEKYAYVIASRIAGVTFAGRVVRHPQTRTGHVRVLVRTVQGVQEIVASNSQGARYRRAKELRWGDALSFDDARLLLPTGT
jgi:ribosomal protein RSM22 (predicted rRNA methylase)